MQSFRQAVLTLSGSAQQLSSALLYASVTDLAIDGTDATKVTSSTHTFTVADVGLYLNVTAGTGFIKKAQRIMSVASGAAFLEGAAGTVSSSSGTAVIGLAGVEDRPVRYFTIQHAAGNTHVAYLGDANVSSTLFAEELAKPASSVPAAKWTSEHAGGPERGVLRLSDFWVLGTNAEVLHLGIYWA